MTQIAIDGSNFHLGATGVRFGTNLAARVEMTSLNRIYAWYTLGFIGFVLLLALLERLGMSKSWIGFSFLFATVGVYGMRQSAFDLYLMGGLALLGVLMRRFDFPIAPVIVGLIMGPLAEAQMRNALSIGEGRWTVFIDRPMSLFLLIVVALVLVTPRLLAWHRRA